MTAAALCGFLADQVPAAFVREGNHLRIGPGGIEEGTELGRRVYHVFADLEPRPASWHSAADPHVPALPPVLHTTSLERLYETICHGPAVRSWLFVYRPWP